MALEHLSEVVQKLCYDSGFDSETAALIVETYLTQAEEILEKLLQMIKNDNHEAYTEIEGLMHKLKGSSGNVRAAYIMSLAMEAERIARDEDAMHLLQLYDEISKCIKMYRFQLSEGIEPRIS